MRQSLLILANNFLPRPILVRDFSLFTLAARPTIQIGVGAYERPEKQAQKKPLDKRLMGCLQKAVYFTCLPINPAISNMDTCGLPKTASNFASALIMRLLA